MRSWLDSNGQNSDMHRAVKLALNQEAEHSDSASSIEYEDILDDE